MRPDGRDPAELFLGSEAGATAYREAMERATEAALDATGRAAPYSGDGPDDHEERLAGFDPLPDEGRGLRRVIEEVGEHVLSRSVDPSNPRCVAHLQCPPAVPGLAAEAMATALNQSLDSWDQSPAATLLEQRMIDELCGLFGYDGGDGVFTGGGTQSNLMGLLLARERRCREAFGRSPREEGLPPEADALRIVCSEATHFTVRQAAAQLGLGEERVVSVPTNAGELSVEALDRVLEGLYDRGLDPFALVATAGTTDFGAIDPLEAMAERAAEYGAWFHVDAAYGGALALSDEHRGKLAGIERADSIAVDFHKLFYQPISCGAFLLRDGDDFELMGRNAAYLNPEGDAERGVPNLVSKSLQTTRRFDALKPYVTFRALGREGLAEPIEYTLDLAEAAAERLASDPAFELLHEPTINTVVFRYRPTGIPGDASREEWTDRINGEVRRRLLASGEAIVARTAVDGVTSLKLTLLNPRTTLGDVEAIMAAIREHGTRIEAGGVAA
ncbi:aspartate aminotransferase family protein [Halalkalicoccus sp. NIPERK01]|uniref:pyridoxal phosphate-dependent decarboxylase family protein n=1 Tax=Halalkalicoccus sp. NIPERK01 TaxID=3053469 RepID=UPI00256ED3C4|nr:aspartate aminotransferase family protein [Halalkalicoccus sp. NIPERK01]MDL5363067.1 aspartate aminotransferase family protein [Halalkalicoccus sp. NIPERK01]